ncbi:hypothetical protein BOX15_Mlig012362g1 [Macrostomum lignano]|uniref:Mab-21-like HhH/H2TH-like domain-containing protein n=2 Tax=Macrostomum lignano TaxID=282301 RepID=A0A267G6V1_9PLAT|nr:hypothetical protein BOX15_Mlig012362g1 [Macrostomum lignano]
MSQSCSEQLSAAMSTAGFKLANARIQIGHARAFEEMIRSATHCDLFFVFGSFCDGWGSCLTRLDGRVEDDSDVDVSFFLDLKPLHLNSATCPSCTAGGEGQPTPAVYSDGHVPFNHDLSQPNLDIPKSDAAVAFDFIMVVPCCGYPRIELLQPGYSNRRGQPSQMPAGILRTIREEVLGSSPRCHAVTASPPGRQGHHVRVSTTLLERAIMHSLTIEQGQFFIIVKFLIKKVIRNKMSGLKTYVAKNLLFYMLDETPEEDWKPENLLQHVRRSLQLLVEMMESSDFEDVCMKHFFLRDANVYFKNGHSSKFDIKEAVNEISDNLTRYVRLFKSSLYPKAVESVEFYIFFPLVGLLEILSSDAINQYDDAYKFSIKVYAKLLDSEADVSLDEGQQQELLEDIGRIPDCASIVKRMLKSLWSAKFRNSQRSAEVADSDLVITGIPSHEVMTVEQAKSISLEKLQQSGMLDFELMPDGRRISHCWRIWFLDFRTS